jgi:hypothetical protein
VVTERAASTKAETIMGAAETDFVYIPRYTKKDLTAAFDKIMSDTKTARGTDFTDWNRSVDFSVESIWPRMDFILTRVGMHSRRVLELRYPDLYLHIEQTINAFRIAREDRTLTCMIAILLKPMGRERPDGSRFYSADETSYVISLLATMSPAGDEVAPKKLLDYFRYLPQTLSARTWEDFMQHIMDVIKREFEGMKLADDSPEANRQEAEDVEASDLLVGLCKNDNPESAARIAKAIGAISSDNRENIHAFIREISAYIIDPEPFQLHPTHAFRFAAAREWIRPIAQAMLAAIGLIPVHIVP